jgi:predicted RND superfamily exporter protein
MALKNTPWGIFYQFNQRFWAFTSFFYFLTAAIGLWFSILLYKNLRTDMEELLPENARSVIDYNEVTNRIPSYQNLAILIFSQNTQASKKFVDDLGKQLTNAHSEVLEYLEYQLTNEIKFFDKKKALMIDVADLKWIRQYITQRIEYETALYNPLTIFSEVHLEEPKFDMHELKKKYEKRASWVMNLPEGYYSNPDQTVRLMLAHLAGRGLHRSIELQQLILKSVKNLNPASYASDLNVRLTGTVEDVIEESQALVEDLEVSTLIVTVLVFLVMILFYRSFWGAVLLNVALFIGVFWTFGISYGLVGYLNANTGFLASIVIGNGINFGVIYLARYVEERRKKQTHEQALLIATKRTIPATATAAIAAGLSYGSLMLTEFRGFSQFGVIGFCGMIACWLSTYTALPAFLTGFERIFGASWLNTTSPRVSFGKILAQFIAQYSKTALTFCFLLTLISASLLPRIREGLVLNDLSKLRDKRCMTTGSGSLFHYINELLQFPASPSFILPQTAAQSFAIEEELQKKAQDKASHITSIFSIQNFVPTHQAEKIHILQEIKELLSPQILRFMDPKNKQEIYTFLNEDAFKPFDQKDLPDLVLRKFREKDGSIGKMLVIDRNYDPQQDNYEDLQAFVTNVRNTVDKIAPGTAIVGSTFINFDLFEAIHRDGPKATLFAFLSVAILVIILFHRFSSICQVLGALIVGVFWLLGLMLGFGIKINFLNFIALPITFGIGVDYAVNILQRLKESQGNLIETLGNTAGAVILVSLTTSLGYGSLLIAGNQAFVSFGALAILGELSCVLAAVVGLPAFMNLMTRNQKPTPSSHS